MIAAIYTVLTYAAAALNLAYQDVYKRQILDERCLENVNIL